MNFYPVRPGLMSVFILGFFLLNVNFINAQDSETSIADTVDVQSTIELSEISRKSAELTLKAKRLVSHAIDETELNRLKKDNENVIKNIDSLLKRESFVRLTSLSNRNLKSKLTYWQKNLQTVNDQQSELSSTFEDLEESSDYLKKELLLWNKTDKLVKGDEIG